MPFGQIFNDPSGTIDQQTCDNSCDIIDSFTQASGRLNSKNNPFDVYWDKMEDPEASGEYLYYCTKGLDKCFTCPYMSGYFDTNP
jgi:hypothetical protein